MEDEFTYRDLRTVHQMEKRMPNLTSIDKMFYRKAGSYISKLEESLENTESSRKRRIIEDELRSAKQTLNGIYELREKKIVLSALSKMRGGNPDLKYMLEEEREIFDEIIECLDQGRKKILLWQKTNEGKEKEEYTPENTESIKENLESPDDSAEVEIQEDQEEREDRCIAIIDEDIPTFVGPNMKRYSLRKNDIVSLPKEIYAILEMRGVARRVI